MQFEQVLIGAVVRDQNNKRLRTDENYLALRESLRRFGQQIPIVVRHDNVIVKGNGTHLAATELGWETIWIHRTGLKGKDADLYAIADNRIAELSEWDYEQLSMAMQSDDKLAEQLVTLGWTEQLLAPLKIAVWTPLPVDKLELPPPDPHLEPVLFYDFTGADMAVVAEAVAWWRNRHPGSKGKTDVECLVDLCRWYVGRPKELL